MVVLAGKLGIRPGMAVALLRPPPGFEDLIGAPVDGIGVTEVADADLVVVFLTAVRELVADVPPLAAQLASDGVLWVAWPKKTSGVGTDVTDHAVRDVALPLGWVDNKVCAIDATWTALRLVLRRELRARPRP